MVAFWKTCFIAWLVVVVVMSLIPDPPVPHSGLLGWDKLHHAAAYGVLTMFGGLAFMAFFTAPAERWLMAMTVAVVMGGILEIVQELLTTGRTAEWGDLVADGIGALVAAACGIFMNVQTARRREGSSP